MDACLRVGQLLGGHAPQSRPREDPPPRYTLPPPGLRRGVAKPEGRAHIYFLAQTAKKMCFSEQVNGFKTIIVERA